MKVYPKESFHQIKLTKPSSKSSRVCCLGGSAEFSSAMERTQYTVLPKTADVMILWGPKFLRRNTIPLRNRCALKGGKHLMPLKHYHFLGMKLQIKIPYSRKFSLAGSGWKTWHKTTFWRTSSGHSWIFVCTGVGQTAKSEGRVPKTVLTSGINCKFKGVPKLL